MSTHAIIIGCGPSRPVFPQAVTASAVPKRLPNEFYPTPPEFRNHRSVINNNKKRG